jgi:hypothetical protein
MTYLLDSPKKVLLAVAQVFLLASCSPSEPPAPPSSSDQCMRREIFQQCLAAVPRGPERVATSNDWDEVVAECETAAYRQSIRMTHTIKQECRVGRGY